MVHSAAKPQGLVALFTAFTAVAALACGDGHPSQGLGTGTGANDGAGGSILPPPTPDTCSPAAVAADVSHPTTTVGTGAGTCTEALLDAALAAGGVVVFDCGPDPSTIVLTTPKLITHATIVDGGGLVTLSGAGATRLFVIESDVDFTVQNLTLTGAAVAGPRGNGPSADNSGAAIYRHSSSTLTVVGVSFVDNHTTPTGADIGGGAIYSYGGDTLITGSTFDGNSAANGGAIGNLRSNLTITNSVFVNNHAFDHGGGAVALDGQNMDHGKVFTLCGVVARNNRARVEGGAVYRYGYPGESTVIDSTTLDANFADEDAAHAGGLYHHTDTPGAMPLTLTNSTISNNVSANGAGAMFFFNSPVALTNVTIAGNVAQTSLAGGIAANGVSGTLLNCTIADNHADHADSFAGAIIGGGGLTLVNTIVAGNTGGNAWNPVSCTDTATSGDHDLQHPSQQPSGQPDTPCAPGVTFGDPLLAPLADNGGPTFTMALGAGSPALGTGANCPALDQRGVARSDGCDIGAYQHDPP